MKKMTYKKIFDLKFKQQIPTIKLQKDFPDCGKKVAHVALLGLPVKTLKKVMKKRGLGKLLALKEILRKN